MQKTKGLVAPENKTKCLDMQNICGLKQTPKQQHEKFDNVMIANGFSINEYDKCLTLKLNTLDMSLFAKLQMTCSFLGIILTLLKQPQKFSLVILI